MQWRVILAVALLAAILCGCLFARDYAQALCLATAQPLEVLWDQLQAGQSDPDLLSLSRDRWERGLPALSCLVSHDRLEQVSRLLSQAEGFLWMGDLEECAAQLWEVQCLLAAISVSDRLTLQSIF